MRDPIYKPEKFYTDDINDLVQADLEKGGPGSGTKGHQTPKQHAEEMTRKIKEIHEHHKLDQQGDPHPMKHAMKREHWDSDKRYHNYVNAVHATVEEQKKNPNWPKKK